MTEKLWSYAITEDDERWKGACATREEAIAEARAELADEAEEYEVTHFYVNWGYRPLAWEFCDGAERYLENAQERAYDEVGEAAEDWPDVSDEAAAPGNDAAHVQSDAPEGPAE